MSTPAKEKKSTMKKNENTIEVISNFMADILSIIDDHFGHIGTKEILKNKDDRDFKDILFQTATFLEFLRETFECDEDKPSTISIIIKNGLYTRRLRGTYTSNGYINMPYTEEILKEMEEDENSFYREHAKHIRESWFI